ncbi:hypothetical protein HOY82DRAFT_615804 [Tuber indicum]|nr:hypothetical protein HOY82DRAFT_615804 [Tuber indicum]
MTNLEDDASELSSLSSYPSSPGASYSSLILPDSSDSFSHFNLDEDDDLSHDLSSQSPSRVSTPVPPCKRKKLGQCSWVWGKPEEPLGLSVEISDTGNASCVLNTILRLMEDTTSHNKHLKQSQKTIESIMKSASEIARQQQTQQQDQAAERRIQESARAPPLQASQ